MTPKLIRLDACVPPIFDTSAEIAAAAFAVVFLLSTLPTPRAQAQTLVVLHDFSGGADGANPQALLILDKAGNLYGTTYLGGDLTCDGNAGYGCGTVFKIDTSGNETVLYSFKDTPDGAFPTAGLVMDQAGNLYGTTATSGTVFKIDTSGNETVLHSFMNAPDGVFPNARLIMDKAGNLYGTSLGGGSSRNGTVFKLDTSGNETVLHSFMNAPDGAFPIAGVIMDQAGNLYGTTMQGGTGTCNAGGPGCGTVFKLDTTGKETVLHSFTNTPDGALAYGGLVKRGNLYGTTQVGGTYGYGTVFKLDPSGKETVLHSFMNSDGAVSLADLIMDKAGNLYGTTAIGGSSPNCFAGCGVVFKLDTTGKETVLHSFTDSDGAYPHAGLVMDKAGNLYGTTNQGGTYGYGTVFKLNNTTLSKSPTLTSLTSSLNPSIYGQGVTWTAKVTSSGSIMPTGKVRFTWSGYTIGSTTLNSSGVATLTRSDLNADVYPLTAMYAGDANNLVSTSTALNQVVSETTSAATLPSSPNPSAQGQAVTFTAKISSPTVIPKGPVTFTAGKTVLGTAQLSGGKATLTISSLAVGSTKVTATYYGDSNIAKSSASVVQTVR